MGHVRTRIRGVTLQTKTPNKKFIEDENVSKKFNEGKL